MSAEQSADTRLPYDAFLAEKVNFRRSFGFDVSDDEIHPSLKPHQRLITRWAVAGGRRAVFAGFGLGKTRIQLETLRLIRERIGNVTGAGVPTVSPFHAEALMHGRRHGFDYLGMITVVTDVVRENNQTYRLGWSEQCKDATKMGVGSPEYILLFHKPQTDRTRGYADVPVAKTKQDYSRSRWQIDAHAFWRSSGNRSLTPDELAALPPEHMSRLFTDQTLREIYDYEAHVRTGEILDARGALPATFMSLAPGSPDPAVWHDVNRMLTLNTEQSRRAHAMHVCPLQFDIVDRLITRFTNPGELVYDPFGGLFTVPVRALRLGRRGRAVELNPDYYRDGVAHLQAAERSADMPALFDLAAAEERSA